MNKKGPMEGSPYDQLQAYNLLQPPQEIEQADGKQGQVTLQTESPEYLSDFDSNPLSEMVSSNREVLESIKKVLSIGALDELVPPLPPNSSSTIKENKDTNFQVSYPLRFSEFII